MFIPNEKAQGIVRPKPWTSKKSGLEPTSRNAARPSGLKPKPENRLAA